MRLTISGWSYETRTFDVTGGQATSVTFTDLNTEGWGTLDRV